MIYDTIMASGIRVAESYLHSTASGFALTIRRSSGLILSEFTMSKPIDSQVAMRFSKQAVRGFQSPFFIVNANRLLLLLLIGLSAPQCLRADFVVFAGAGKPVPTEFSLVTTNRELVYGVSVGQSPVAGTPAYETFSGNVSFGIPTTYLLQEDPAGSVLAHVLTGLNPNRRYALKGTTIRGGYPDRWTLFELLGAQSIRSAHTTNCLTTAQVPDSGRQPGRPQHRGQQHGGHR